METFGVLACQKDLLDRVSRVLIGLNSELEIISYFLNRGVHTVTIKSGDVGGTREHIVRIPTMAPRGLLHTIGVGDTFVGGLLYYITNGMVAL